MASVNKRQKHFPRIEMCNKSTHSLCKKRSSTLYLKLYLSNYLLLKLSQMKLRQNRE